MPAASPDSATATCPSLADLVALDPSVQVEVATVHAATSGVDAAPSPPSLWIWSTRDRFTPRRFHEATLDASIAAARDFLRSRLVTTSNRALRTRDEQEGGIIIPDYMY